MPKIVNAEERRDAVVDAVFTVITARGLDAATLSSIAAEASLSIGSVRHYFASHDELLQFAVDALTTRIAQRLKARVSAIAAQSDGPPRERRESLVVDLLLEVLPIDEERRRESTVWLEFATASRTRPALIAQSQTLHTGLAALSRRVIDNSVSRGIISAAHAADETERLHALLDGLTMHGVFMPSADYAERACSIVRMHLASLS